MAEYNKIDYKKIAVIIIIFTLLDYLVHLVAQNIPFFPHLEVLPSFYFIGKIIVLLIAIPIVLRIKVLNTLFKRCIVLAILLQVRYFIITSYDLTTHVVMMLVHYVMLRVAFMLSEKMEV